MRFCMKMSPEHTRFKTVRQTTIRNGSKLTISSSGELGLLQKSYKNCPKHLDYVKETKMRGICRREQWKLTETVNLSSSLSCFCWSCLWRAWFSSDNLSLLARICDCTRARVCMHLNVDVACLLTDWPCINDFSLTNPLNARRALLA